MSFIEFDYDVSVLSTDASREHLSLQSDDNFCCRLVDDSSSLNCSEHPVLSPSSKASLTRVKHRSFGLSKIYKGACNNTSGYELFGRICVSMQVAVNKSCQQLLQHKCELGSE